MADLVDEQNFSLGCRVCRKLLKGSVCYFESTIPDYSSTYLEAFNLICSLNVWMRHNFSFSCHFLIFFTIFR